MGVDLSPVVSRQTKELSDFSGKVVAIDAYNSLYQFLATIRQPDGTPLTDDQGRVTSHLSGLYYRSANLLEIGIKAVWVFDGAPLDLKLDTLRERAERKEKAEAERLEALRSGDLATAKSKAQQTSKLTRPMADEAKTLLRHLGVPVIEAPRDGEAQASHLVIRGDAWACASQDYDSLLFGAPRLIRNLTISGRRKMPGRMEYVDVKPEYVELDTVLAEIGLSRAQLVDVGLLVGTDFNEGIRGIGPKKGVKNLKDSGSIEALKEKGIEIPNLERLREVFLKPEVTDDYRIEFAKCEPEAVIALLCGEHGFSEQRVKAALERIKETEAKSKQRTLEMF
jgi:flap endonuclease-1